MLSAILSTIYVPPMLTAHLSTMLQTGANPASLLEVHPVPLDKPGTGPASLGSKGPISLIYAILKFVEAAMFTRVIRKVEYLYTGEQYAYRRARGTDAHLAMLPVVMTGQP